MDFLNNKSNPNIKNLKRPAHGGNIYEKYSTNLDKWKELLDFSTNINPLGPSKKALKVIKNNFWQISYYPETNSTLLREEISNYFNKIIPSESIIVCSGLTELIDLTASVFIQVDTKVLIPIPTYEEYAWAVNKYGGQNQFVLLDSNNNFKMDQLIQHITKDLGAIYICNPNNPTSRLENSKFMTEIIELAEKNEILVFIDEAFIDYCDSKSSQIFQINSYPNLIVFRSFTKFFALTGLRIGYGVANKNIIELLMKAKLSWNVNCLAQTAAIYSLKDHNFIIKSLRIMNNEKNYLLNSLNQIDGIKVFPPDTNFILIQLNSNIDPKIFEKKLLKNKIMIRNCGSFQGLDDSFFRIGIKLQNDNKKLIICIKKILEEENNNTKE